jgi:hypothetical protein
MSFFKRKGPSNIDINGFWNREQGEVLQGKFLKFVPNDRNPKQAKPFIIIQATGGTAQITTEGEKKPHKVKAGEYVGVSANWSIKSVLDMVKDIGKEVRLTVTGTAPNPNGGKPMVLFDVEVDEPDEPDEQPPF